MPRISRKNLNSNYFHVIVQGIEKSYIFNKYILKEKYKKLMIEKLKNYDVKVLAYCIMDNHAHMLIYSEKIEDLSGYMKSINTSFALFYNKINERVGYVFRNRFKSVVIKNQIHLYKTLTYIHLNPVCAKICSYPELYAFSSYNDFLKEKGIIGKRELELLNFNMNQYKKMFVFMHHMYVDGVEFEKIDNKSRKEGIIQSYINEKNIKDIIFQPDKVKKMIEDLKKEKISFDQIAKFLKVSNKKLKQIISE
ncbi:MAG: transposase [Clostridia bacterium]|nr:transposase [Clostridia bacterium]